MALFVSMPGADGHETVRLAANECEPVRCKCLILLRVACGCEALHTRMTH
jgi:hypothetical protein